MNVLNSCYVSTTLCGREAVLYGAGSCTAVDPMLLFCRADVEDGITSNQNWSNAS